MHFVKSSVGTILLATLCLTWRPLYAQSLAQQTRGIARPGVGPGHVISVNPFLPLLGYFAGEYEQRVTPAVAVAVAGSHTKPGDTRYSNLDAKVRLYPSETALRGFNVAASLGIANIKDEPDVVCEVVLGIDASCDPSSKAFTTGTFAVEAGYQWLLGPSRVTAVSVGAGAKRYLGSESKFRGVERVLPTLRLSIGYAF
jgi:hypothetical protein